MDKFTEKLKLSIMSSFFLSFTFLGFGTLELYMSNHEEFWFSYIHMLPAIILLNILVIVVCVILQMLLPGKFFKYGIALTNGLAFIIYIQGNFLPNDYGVLDGAAIEWGDYRGRLIYNSALWCVLILTFLWLVKKYTEKFFSVSKIVIGIILTTQLITLITMAMMFPKSDNDSILSVDGQFEVSEKNNTIVFVLDCFDSEVFCELLEQYPSDIQRMFEDFTFYHNVVGGATRTKYAIPYIFTGRTNTGDDSYKEYLKKSFDESSLIKELQTEQYDARLYTEAGYIDMQQKKAVDNIISDVLHPVSEWGLTRDFLKLTAFRYAPHIIKRYFWMYSGDFETWKEQDVSYVFDDSAFYQKMNTEKVRSSIEKDAFRFYHLMGPHAPYTMNENCERIKSGQGSEAGQAMGSLRIVSEFVEQLKALGVYENSSIFVIADHGARNYEQNPLFMVKLRGTQKEFEQSEVPLSYKDFPDMVTAALKQQEIDIERYICSGTRYFYVESEENNKINIIEYSTEGEAYDAESFQLTGRIFSGNTGHETYEYHLGEELSFAKDATANMYCKSGFSKNEVTHTWVEGGCAEMYFELSGKYDDLLLELEYGTYAAPQEVIIYANENLIADYAAAGDEKKQIVIPGEYVKDAALNLKFKFPDATSSADLGESSDTRKLSLRMRGLCISSVKKDTFELNSQMMWNYVLGTALSFQMVDSSAQNYCCSGFSYAEDTHTWTDSDTAEMKFIITDQDLNDIMLEYTCFPFNSKQHVILYANDYQIADYDLTGEETKEISIPKEYLADGILNLRFELPDAVSPQSLGVSEDERTLGLGMKSITLR